MRNTLKWFRMRQAIGLLHEGKSRVVTFANGLTCNSLIRRTFKSSSYLSIQNRQFSFIFIVFAKTILLQTHEAGDINVLYKEIESLASNLPGKPDCR